jgi:hypothetical protein
MEVNLKKERVTMWNGFIWFRIGSTKELFVTPCRISFEETDFGTTS